MNKLFNIAMYVDFSGDVPNQKDIEDILTTLYFYGEEEFPELTEEVVIEVLNEVK